VPDYTPQRPRYDVFLALRSLAAHVRQRWIIVSQAKLIERIAAATGYRMSRATLNRHLRALHRINVINRQPRALRKRDGTIAQRPTLYTFGLRGILWIKRDRRASQIPLAPTGVSILRHSRSTKERVGLHAAVDKRSTAPSARQRKNDRAPRYRGGR
jgi:hypothetical protein